MNPGPPYCTLGLTTTVSFHSLLLIQGYLALLQELGSGLTCTKKNYDILTCFTIQSVPISDSILVFALIVLSELQQPGLIHDQQVSWYVGQLTQTGTAISQLSFTELKLRGIVFVSCICACFSDTVWTPLLTHTWLR